MILADTSIWIDHFRSPNPTLIRLMQANELLMHPYVIGELAMGSIAERKLRLRLWAMLPTLSVASLEEILTLVEGRRLYSRGIGFADANLLASSLAQSGTSLWTRDRRLRDVAQELGVLAKLDP